MVSTSYMYNLSLCSQVWRKVTTFQADIRRRRRYCVQWQFSWRISGKSVGLLGDRNSRNRSNQRMSFGKIPRHQSLNLFLLQKISCYVFEYFAAFSGLPSFLVKEGGLNSGFMIVQFTAASLGIELSIADPKTRHCAIRPLSTVFLPVPIKKTTCPWARLQLERRFALSSMSNKVYSILFQCSVHSTVIRTFLNFKLWRWN